MEVGRGETALLRGSKPWLRPLDSPGVHSEGEDHNDVSDVLYAFGI